MEEVGPDNQEVDLQHQCRVEVNILWAVEDTEDMLDAVCTDRVEAEDEIEWELLKRKSNVFLCLILFRVQSQNLMNLSRVSNPPKIGFI